MTSRKRAKSAHEAPRISQDDSLNDVIENSQNSKSRSKNYSADESATLIKCCDKYHAIISKNSSRDKDKKEKQLAWEKIKSDFDQYCQSQGIIVSKILSFSFSLDWLCILLYLSFDLLKINLSSEMNCVFMHDCMLFYFSDRQSFC